MIVSITHTPIAQTAFIGQMKARLPARSGWHTIYTTAWTAKHGIRMVNQTELAKMLEAVDANYDPQLVALLKDEHKFCPKCERQMVLRTAAKGPTPGNRFWGCSAYPRCRYTLAV